MVANRRLPVLMLVVGDQGDALEITSICEKAVQGGVDAIQLRIRKGSRQNSNRIARMLQPQLVGRAQLIINSDVSLALELSCGLHLPGASLPPQEARAIIGERMLLGKSVHSVVEARDCGGADYILVGNVFMTPSKPGKTGIGVSKLRDFVEVARLPVLAIGGVTAANASDVIAAGASGVAVIRAIANSADPKAAARELRAVIDLALSERCSMTQREEADPIEITVNGKALQLDSRFSVSEFLTSRGLHERLLVVELNRSSLNRDRYATTTLANGDVIEIVHAIGGG
ncbi:MAG: sulfur carrier protein ThiS [Chloroflexota bacterium]|nr:sulfur carrier protein ThiS [Chloroflexota bacterium]